MRPLPIFLVANLFYTASIFAGPINYVWFEANGLNPESSVQSQGNQGTDLKLHCNNVVADAVCQWSIAMKMRSQVQFGSQGTNLLGDTSKNSITNILHGNFPSNGHNFQAINSGGKLASFKEVNIPVLPGPIFDPTDGAPGDYLLATFQLNTQKTQGDLSAVGINAAINELLWAAVTYPGNPPHAYVKFGSQPPLDGHISGQTAYGVITINSAPPDVIDGGMVTPEPNIPEPSTMLLMLMSFSALTLRRK